MQKMVDDFNKLAKNNKMPVSARLLDIVSEMGELAKEYLKPSDYGTKEFELTEDFELEFGDCLYSILSLANETEVDAKKCLEKVLSKYKKRLLSKNTMDSRADK